MWPQNLLLKPWAPGPWTCMGGPVSRRWRLSEVIRAEETQLPSPMWGHGEKMETAPLLWWGTSLAGTLVLGIQSPELQKWVLPGLWSFVKEAQAHWPYGASTLPLSKWNLCVGEGASATWNFLTVVGFLLSFVSMSLFILNWMHKFFNESTIVFKLEAGNKKSRNVASPEFWMKESKNAPPRCS